MFIGQLYRDKKKTQFTRVFIQQNLAFALYKCLNLLWRHILLFLSIFLDQIISKSQMIAFENFYDVSLFSPISSFGIRRVFSASSFFSTVVKAHRTEKVQ